MRKKLADEGECEEERSVLQSKMETVVGFGASRSNCEPFVRSAHTLYLCVLCGSENKQRLFPYTALTDWFL